MGTVAIASEPGTGHQKRWVMPIVISVCRLESELTPTPRFRLARRADHGAGGAQRRDAIARRLLEDKHAIQLRSFDSE